MMPFWKDSRQEKPGRRFVAASLLAVLAVCSGCKLCHHGAKWGNAEPQYAQVICSTTPTATSRYALRSLVVDGPSAADLARQAGQLEACHDPRCVDLYFDAVYRQWSHLAALGDLPARDDLLEESRLYNAYLAKLLVTAQRYSRLDPGSGLHVVYQGRPLTVPVELYGFAWKPEDFNNLELVGDYKLDRHIQAVRHQGVGVPLLVRRLRPADDQFFRRLQPFAATAVLRTREPTTTTDASGCKDAECKASGCKDPGSATELVLEFYNPAHCTHLAGKHERWIVAGDLTAPWAWTASVHPNQPIKAFLRPDSVDAGPQLVMLEPYQPGKIPIVFVHGLASDPTTWLTIHNTLRSQDWFRERYQVWAFRYPTGIPFLRSAAALRRELQAAVTLSPGAAEDPAVQQMVLVGHSMGGLIAKLQVTSSGNELWNLVAKCPLDSIHTDATTREQLRQAFYFEPLPFVRQVIFIGTPHRGSSMAAHALGRVSSCAASLTKEADQRHRQLMTDNPDVFVPWMARKVPTSIDLLEPDHPLLVAMEKMPVACNVQLHSIIGVAKTHGRDGPGDSVVPMSSARHAGVESEKLVSETHLELLHAATTSMEIERILEKQLRDFDRSCQPVGPSAQRFQPLQ